MKAAEPGTFSVAGSDGDEAGVWGSVRKARSLLRQPLFILTVIAPTLLAIAYFGFLADDVYVSESRFVVRSPSKASVSPLGAILNAGGLSGSSEETNAVIEYIESRDSLSTIDKDGMVRKAYGPDHASWFDRFGGMFGGTSQEHFYRYFADKVTVETDPVTQVAHLTVRAFDPKDAEAINARLLSRAEMLVNTLAERSRGDAISVAEKELDNAKDAARSAALALANFRNRNGIIDPEQEAEVRLQMISKLQDELITSRAQLKQMQTYTPQASQIPYLRSQVASLEREIGSQTNQIAGGNRSLSAAAVRYQELRLDSMLREKQLAATLAAYEEAMSDARRKRAYLERIASPSLPDYAMEPRRIRGIVATLLLGLLVWGVLSTLLAGIREHRD